MPCNTSCGIHTSVPWASDSSLAGQNTLDERCTVMGAVGAHGVHFIPDLGQEHLAAFNTLNLAFLLLAILQVDAGQALELEFSSHIAKTGGEESRSVCSCSSAKGLT